MKPKKQIILPAGGRHTGEEPQLLREIVRTHQVLMNGFTREVGMPSSRLALMRILANPLSDAVGIMDLSRRLGVNAAAITRQVKEMENEGLLMRRPDARDGRRSYVKLSAKGLKMFKNIHNRSLDLQRMLALHINSKEMKAATNVLGRLRRVIEGLR